MYFQQGIQQSPKALKYIYSRISKYVTIVSEVSDENTYNNQTTATDANTGQSENGIDKLKKRMYKIAKRMNTVILIIVLG